MNDHSNNGYVTVPLATEQAKSARGCSQSGGAPEWMAALVALGAWILRRRRASSALATSAALAAAAAMTLVGCGPTQLEQETPPPEALAQVKHRILGGAVDGHDPAVFELFDYYSNGQGGACTGTLIGPRTILTAAHCADPAMGNASSVQIWVMNKTDDQTASQSDLIAVDNAKTRLHPDWNPNTLEGDMALLYLSRAPAGVTPAPWNAATLSGLTNAAVRSVGYGITSASGQDSGVRHEVSLTIRQIASDGIHFYVGNELNKGICHGDSGGPTFHTFPDGVERVIGVHSYDANGQCTLGGVVRTDRYQSFINQWMSDYEGPQCTQDGQCRQGCAQPDLDCYCVDDSVCNPKCPVLSDDPDCPKDCGPNNVCSIEPCPIPDPDCVALGKTCTAESQCLNRVCISDPQHPGFYCSRPCEQSAECPLGMECVSSAHVCRYPQLPTANPGETCQVGKTYCSGQSVCTGPTSGGATHCEPPCNTNADCSGKATCEYGVNNAKFCDVPYTPPVFVPLAKLEKMPEAKGCAAVGGSPFVLLGALSLLRRRRR